MSGNHRTVRAIGALIFAGTLLLAGCGSSKSDAGAKDATTTPAAPKELQVLVTNDDGYDAPGIDAIVEALRSTPNVKVTVVAPATNQSGKGGTVTGGALTATDAMTKSGYPAKAVAGTPADSVIWALDQGGITFKPDFVVSGINAGQNMGPLVDLSGTVGAARAATSRGIASIATSQGLTNGNYDFKAGVEQVMTWFTKNRSAIGDHTITTATVFNMNIPTCPTGSVRGQLDVAAASSADGYLDVPNCTSTVTGASDDIKAFQIGFAPVSDLPIKPAS